MKLSNNFKLSSLFVATGLALMSGAANAGYTIKTSDDASITFGGFVAADVKHIDGNVAPLFNDFWIGTGYNAGQDISLTKMSVSSSRLNTKYVNGDTMAFVEMDFYTGEGNEVLTNSVGPRLRHAFIKHGNWTVGQTWSTFVNTGALAEAVDFGGPLVASAFVRQTQIRYTNGGFQFAIENPESYGGDGTQDAMPDVVGKYTMSGDWGSVSFAGVFRSLNTAGGESETGLGFGVSGKVNVGEKDDFRFQLHGGNTGRYVGAAAATDLVGEEVEDVTSILVSYRHHWNDTYRSSVFYGNTTTDKSDRDRTHWGVNLFQKVSGKLTRGYEVGNFEMADADADSTYLQFIAKFVL
jgi:hypothetical protein